MPGGRLKETASESAVFAVEYIDDCDICMVEFLSGLDWIILVTIFQQIWFGQKS